MTGVLLGIRNKRYNNEKKDANPLSEGEKDHRRKHRGQGSGI